MSYELKSYNRWMNENETSLHDYWIENEIDESFESWTHEQYLLYKENVAEANYDYVH